MATLATSQQWLSQSSLLLEARPETTRITCRYSVAPKAPRRAKKGDTEAKTPASATTPAAGQNPRALLVLKTVDTSSGVCLKYKTNKAAEVSRLVQLLGQLSRRQAGLISGAASAEEQQQEDVAMGEAGEAEAAAAAAAEPTPAAAAATPAAQQQSGGGGKGKGKKKSKR